MCFETYIHAQNTTKHSVFKHTYTLKRLRKHEILRNLSVYVCFKTLCFVVFLKQIHTRWRLNFIEKYESVCMFEAYIHTRLAAWDIHTHTLGRLRHTYMLRGLRHTYIHTYSLFARRINIDLNCCAPNFQKIWAAILLKQNGLFLKGN